MEAVRRESAEDVASERHRLLLDPRHTGINHLSESLFLMHLGALQWSAISRHAGVRLRELRGEGDCPVYASFFYVWLQFGLERPSSAYEIDDLVTVDTSVELCGEAAIDGHHVIRHEDQAEGRIAGPHRPGAWCHDGPARARMSNVFVRMRGGPDDLAVTLPRNLVMERFPRGPECLDTYPRVKQVRADGGFPLDPGQVGPRLGEPRRYRLPINPDRDINGVGLVYFANYVTFLDTAERRWLEEGADSNGFDVARRALVEREIAYYGNAQGHDALDVEIEGHRVTAPQRDRPDSELLRLDYRVYRVSDGALICISSAVKQVELKYS